MIAEALFAIAVLYPHSVIPGGEQPGFGRIYPHGEMHAWVSYVDDSGATQITDRRVTIKAYETVLIHRDGTLTRGRCGNRIFVAPPPLRAYVPPTPADIDVPEVYVPVPNAIPASLEVVDIPPPDFAEDLPIDRPFRPPPNTLPPVPSDYFWDVPIVAGGPLPIPVQARGVPEPGTWMLVIAGGVVAVLRLVAEAIINRRSARRKMEADRIYRLALYALKEYVEKTK